MRMLLILLPIMIMVGCGTHSSDTNKNENTERVSVDGNNNITSDNTESTDDEEQRHVRAAAESNDTNHSDGKISDHSIGSDEPNKKKQTIANKYKNRLDDLEEQLKPIVEKSQKGSQDEMDEAVAELYERWDVALNEVYNALERKLSDEEMEALRKEQRKWIKKRDKYAKKEGKEWKGGSLYSFALTEAKMEFTKDRCYELVEDYME